MQGRSSDRRGWFVPTTMRRCALLDALAVVSTLAACEGPPASSPAPPAAAPPPVVSGRAQALSSLPAGYRSIEAIPSVIRDDGVESFRLEVGLEKPVLRVFLESVAGNLVAPASLELRDDGVAPDRVAGDRIFTLGPLSWRPGGFMPPFLYDNASPAGLHFQIIGAVSVEETPGVFSTFLMPQPEVGVLRASVPARASRTLSDVVVASDHLINVRTGGFETQRMIRGPGADPQALTFPIFQVFQDQIDFLMLLSIRRNEVTPTLSPANYNAGVHWRVKNPASGIGGQPDDNSVRFGSSGRLHAMNVLDHHSRGVNSVNAVHELCHQWAAYVDESTALKRDGAHYSGWSSVASPLGGFKWNANGDGSFTIDKRQGAGGANLSPPLDRYLAGFIPASEVPPLYVLDRSLPITEITVVQPHQIERTVTIDDIIALHGPRQPDHAHAQKSFTIGFVAESSDRFLTSTELTFYDILAEHFTRPIPAGSPAPYLGSISWSSIARFFGDGTTWTTRLPPPAVNRAQALDPFLEQGGLVVMEAESYAQLALRSDPVEWVIDAAVPGYGGAGYVHTPDGAGPARAWDDASDLKYEFRLASAGTRHVWVRRSAPDDGASSAMVGVNGRQVGDVLDDGVPGAGWVWVKHGTVMTSGTRNGVLNLRRREDGYRIDRIILAASASYVPSGVGPAESERGLQVTGLKVGSGRPYAVADNALVVGATQYIDRAYTFTQVPAVVAGATYIMTAAEDKRGTDEDTVSFVINRNTRVFIGVDTRIPVPGWMAGGFSNTGQTLVSTTASFRLYERTEVAGTTVSLGPNAAPNNTSVMYTVVLVPTP
jgi:hypothetical protein